LLVFSGASEAGTKEAAASERPAWLRPLDHETEIQAKARTEPTNQDAKKDSGNWAGWSKLEPGVLDVQAWDWLQQDLNRMLDLTTAPPPNHLSSMVFEERYLGATVEYLDVDAEEGRIFEVAVGKALDELAGARDDMLRQAPKQAPSGSNVDETAAMLESRASWTAYRKAQSHAARHPLDLLQELPRHELLRETMLKWLLRLEYGIEAAGK